MQPQESPGNMLLFLCHRIVNIRKLNMNVNLNIGLGKGSKKKSMEIFIRGGGKPVPHFFFCILNSSKNA